MFHWMFWCYIDPYWGSSLSKLALNVRIGHVRQVTFLRATFLSYYQENRITFLPNRFSGQTQLLATIINFQSIALVVTCNLCIRGLAYLLDGAARLRRVCLDARWAAPKWQFYGLRQSSRFWLKIVQSHLERVITTMNSGTTSSVVFIDTSYNSFITYCGVPEFFLSPTVPKTEHLLKTIDFFPFFYARRISLRNRMF